MDEDDVRATVLRAERVFAEAVRLVERAEADAKRSRPTTRVRRDFGDGADPAQRLADARRIVLEIEQGLADLSGECAREASEIASCDVRAGEAVTSGRDDLAVEALEERRRHARTHVLLCTRQRHGEAVLALLRDAIAWIEAKLHDRKDGPA